MKVEFLYFDECPSYQAAETLLREALAEEGQAAEIVKIKIENEADAQRWQFLGSPTIRFDGVDPFEQGASDYGLECRVFVTPQGLQGWPTKAMLRNALKDMIG
jgi:hypothetical protein